MNSLSTTDTVCVVPAVSHSGPQTFKFYGSLFAVGSPPLIQPQLCVPVLNIDLFLFSVAGQSLFCGNYFYKISINTLI